MATRKKKSDGITLEMPGTIGGAKVVFTEPTIVKGSHLTVTTYPDGKTTLEWDDDALMRDVREAIASVEFNDSKPAARIKVVTKAKKKAKE
jgi:hypothetical protein